MNTEVNKKINEGSKAASKVLTLLENAGYEAYFVGGCVRDAIMGNYCKDIDVATNALPAQVECTFADHPVIPTGIKHGTVTVLMSEKWSEEGETESMHRIPVEITTYRSDGQYSDSRHPDKVRFLSSIEDDLARRDFTINAMACDGRGNVKDPYGGKADIENKILRAVGNADTRFKEDALRIMRAMRFASVLGFEIEPETEAAMLRNRQLLEDISPERVFAEFKKLVTGKNAGVVIRKYVDVLGVVIPELLAMKGFEQHNSYHKYDVLEHCIRAMEVVKTTSENAEYMKLAALFHDIGKPDTYFMDEDGVGHFYGHPEKSRELVSEIMKRFKADRFTTDRIALLDKYHDLIFEKDERFLKRWMNRLGPDMLAEILEIKLADNFATGNMSPELEAKFGEIREMMRGILNWQQCFSLKDLAVTGNDIIAAGVPVGPEVGRILKELLEAVIDGTVKNEKAALMRLVDSTLKGV